MTKAKAAFLLLATTSIFVPSCADEGMDGEDNGPAGGKADEADELDPADFKCQSIENQSEREGNILEQLHDPMADMLKLSGCATGLRDLMKRFETTDKEGCDGGMGAGLTTHPVTEHGQTTFGERDSWSDNPGMTFHTATALQRRFIGFTIEALNEVENDRPTALCEPKHWHLYEVLARRA